MKTFNKSIILLFIFSFLLISCNKEDSQLKDLIKRESLYKGVYEVDFIQYAIGKSGGKFTLSLQDDPKTFNSIIGVDHISKSTTSILFSSLLEKSSLTNEWLPSIIESWQVSEDKKNIICKVQKGLKWSDGNLLNANDVVFTYNQIYLRKEIEYTNRENFLINNLPVNVKLIDDYSFSLSTDIIVEDILELCNIVPYPKHIISPLINWSDDDGHSYEYEIIDGQLVELNADHIKYSEINSMWNLQTDITQIIGNGPFKISEYKPGKKLTYTKNPFYFKKDEVQNQLPYFDEIVILIDTEKSNMLNNFISGKTDFYELSGFDYSRVINESETRGIDLYYVKNNPLSVALKFNSNPIHNWNSNENFRLAIGHIIDNKQIINNIAYGFGSELHSNTPGYNPEQAEYLLDNLGWIDNNGDGFREDNYGNKISLNITTISGDEEKEKICELLSANAKKIGIDILIQSEDENILMKRISSDLDWDIILMEENSFKNELYIENNPSFFIYKKELIYGYKNKLGNIFPMSESQSGWTDICEYLYWK